MVSCGHLMGISIFDSYALVSTQFEQDYVFCLVLQTSVSRLVKDMLCRLFGYLSIAGLIALLKVFMSWSCS